MLRLCCVAHPLHFVNAKFMRAIRQYRSLIVAWMRKEDICQYIDLLTGVAAPRSANPYDWVWRRRDADALYIDVMRRKEHA